MTKTQNTAQAALPKRLSPELAEVLHMLKSLEAQSSKLHASAVTR